MSFGQWNIGRNYYEIISSSCFLICAPPQGIFSSLSDFSLHIPPQDLAAGSSMDWGPSGCIFNKFPCDANAPGLGTTGLEHCLMSEHNDAASYLYITYF